MAEAEEHRDEQHAGDVSELRAAAEIGGAVEQVAAIAEFFAEAGEYPDDDEIAQGEFPIVSETGDEG